VAAASRGPRSSKIITDLAVTLAMGGDCLADVAVLRNSPEVFGPVASDPTISRPVSAPGEAGPKALRLIRGRVRRHANRCGRWPGRRHRAPVAR
jgi:hypothetical protein